MEMNTILGKRCLMWYITKQYNIIVAYFNMDQITSNENKIIHKKGLVENIMSSKSVIHNICLRI